MVERRLTWLAGILLLWGAAIFYKIVSIQVLHHQEYVRMARARQELLIDLPAPRGTIYDRTGAPLAMSVPTASVYINPSKVPDLGVASDILSMVLHLDRTDLYGKIKLAADSRRGFLWIKRKITSEEQQSVRNLRLSWIGMESESQRRYPGGSLAAHVLGGVDFQEKGNGGVEKALDEILRGEPGQARLLTDVKRRGIDQQLDSEAKAGTSITLTIDERLQFVAERELAAAAQAHSAVSGSIVVMNPYDGQIYALASYPTYDPNTPPEPGSMMARMNHATSVPFEPGSVFKVITLSAALETTALRPETPINCHGGVLKLPGRVVHDSHAGLGIIPMAMVLAKSSNIGAIEVGARVGQGNMYEYVRRFGFGQRTGVELPAESPGRVRKVANWGKTSLASISMGQEVSVTTVQLAQAGAAVANGGLRVHPHLVLRQGDRPIQPQAPVRVLKPESTITMRQMMEGVVMPGGTGYPKAKLEGYSVGGKTGSAQIFDVATHRYTHSYNASFVGLAPLTNPAIVVVVTLNGTHGNAGFGGAASAPVFHTIATEALRILDVPRDVPEEEKPVTTRIAAAKEDTDDLAIADLGSEQPNILEDGDPDDGGAVPIGPKVPNFRGMSMRTALAEAAKQGIALIPDGSGVAIAQMPPPGAVLHEGERIRVRFSR